MAFKNAKTLSSAKTAKGSDKANIEVPGMGFRAGLRFLKDVIETAEATLDERCKGFMATIFVKNGCAKKGKPDSFKGYENISRIGAGGEEIILAASASCEFRKRSTNSPVSSEERAILEENGIEVTENVTVVDTFAFNPDLVARAADDTKVAEFFEEVEAAIRKIVTKKLPGIDPDTVIVHQEKVSKFVITDNSVTQVFCKPTDVAEKLLPLVGTLAIKPTIATDNVNDVWPFLTDLLGVITPTQVAEFQKSKESKRKSFTKPKAAA
jgi:hypothetical protein